MKVILNVLLILMFPFTLAMIYVLVMYVNGFVDQETVFLGIFCHVLFWIVFIAVKVSVTEDHKTQKRIELYKPSINTTT
jgi:hypothetical protein